MVNCGGMMGRMCSCPGRRGLRAKTARKNLAQISAGIKGTDYAEYSWLVGSKPGSPEWIDGRKRV